VDSETHDAEDATIFQGHCELHRRYRTCKPLSILRRWKAW